MIEDKIEIMIPTYNRANYLNDTLNALLNSPFKNCRITVRDNASLDNTPEICKKYEELFDNLVVVRNNKDIGGNANIIRCYEKAEMEYVWVLADNDVLNFDDCDDFINAIESEKYDLIICSSGNIFVSNSQYGPDYTLSDLIETKSSKENYLENSAVDLVSIIQNYYFFAGSFIPSFIYKTYLIDTNYLIKGYNYISRSFPHFPLFVKALNLNVLTYKTKKDIVIFQENPNDSELLAGVEYYVRCLDCALLVKDTRFREYASQIQAHGMLYSSLAHVIAGKVNNEEDFRFHVMDLINVLYKLKGWFLGTIYMVLIFLCSLVPRRLCTFIFENKDGITKVLK